MPETFCKYIKYQIRYDNDSISPCCWISKKANLNNIDEVHDYQKWLDSINDWVPECACCEIQEKKGFTSYRQNYDKVFEENEYSAEFQFDSECNAACLICGDYNSTTWEKYNLKNSNKKITLVDADRKKIIEKRFENILNTLNFKKLKKVTFLGGEPFKTNSHIQILNILKNTNGLNDIRVSYVSNGSFLPTEEAMKLWKLCRHVEINFSIDGTDSHFEYLRWPLSWSQITNNLYFYKKLDFIDISFSHAVNPFNIYYYDRYVNWAIDFFRDSCHNGEEMFSFPFHTGGIINMNCVPEELAELVRIKYQSYKYSKNFAGILKPKDNLSKLINKFDQVKYDEFIRYINFHDSKRNLNFRKVFPEIEKYFIEQKTL